MAQGETKGEIRGKKDTLLMFLQERFGTVESALTATINATTDLQRLNRWLSLILKVESLVAFRAAAGI